MLFCRANLATSLIFLMLSSSSRFKSATPLRGVDAMVSWRLAQRWRCGRCRRGPLSALAHRRPRAPAVLWGCFFRGRRTQLQSLQTRCHRAMRTSGLPHTQDQCFKQHRALGTLPKNELLAGPLVPLSCYAAPVPGGAPRRGLAATASGATRTVSRIRAETRPARCTPSTRPGAIGGTASYAGGGYLFLRPPGGHRILLDGCPPERPSGRPKPLVGRGQVMGKSHCLKNLF